MANLIDILQFQGVFAYFQVSGGYSTNFEISEKIFDISLIYLLLC
jgi:hypothetical protein